MSPEEVIKKKVEEWTKRKVRLVDIYSGDVWAYDYIAIFEDGGVYLGGIIYGEVLEGKELNEDDAREYINERAYLSLILEMLIQECWDEEKEAIHSKGIGVYEDAIKLLEKKGLVERKGKQVKLTDYGKMLLKGYVIDLVR